MHESQRPALHDDPTGDLSDGPSDGPSEGPSEGPSGVRPEDRSEGPSEGRSEGRSEAPGDARPAASRTPSRRALLGAGAAVAGSGLLAACGASDTASGPDVKARPYGPHPSRRPPESPGSHGYHGSPGSPRPHGTHKDHDGHGSHDSHGTHDAHGTHGSHGGGGSSGKPPRGYVVPGGREVADCERRRGSGPTRHFTLTAAPTRLELGGGRTVRTWAYGDELPGKEIRVTAGERIALTLHNHLPQSTTLHWHGLHVRNDMDGVPDLTQRACRPGGSYDYRLMVTQPGTHWLHPHVGVQLDRGLYAPLIVEDPREPLSYDREWVVLIDDWIDGIDGHTPDAVLAGFLKRAGRHGGGMGHMGAMGMGMGDDGKGGGGTDTRGGHDDHGHDEHDEHDEHDDRHDRRHGRHKGDHERHHGHHHGSSRRPFGGRRRLWGDPGSVDHPLHLINGRTARHPHTFRARPGDRIRIRIINAGGDTSYRVALGGHRMTVTHTDGFPVRHAKTDALLLGVGERYDVLVTAKDGAFPLTALAEGKRNRSALAVLRTGSGAAPGPSDRPEELRGRLMTADRLKAAPSARLTSRRPDRVIDMTLTGNMARYNWAINGRPYTPYQRYPVREGERVRIVFRNHTRMWHPMHLHGHHFALPHGGPRKDTTIMLPGRRLAVDFDADNPGLWMVHCHNIYHSESGMMTILGYRS
ncbi:multicopper oxidase domain-containing protein [Streptomyces sp. NPDC059649]|uniref:multicopper oxidase domain-containing protein n=1 Tax=Streptomyces sp. NPDC059649 TaxID=3346895 RepID=UPI0036B4B499